MTGSLPQGSRTVAPTKTTQSRRTIAIDPETVVMLRSHRAGQIRPMDREHDFVFRTSSGTPVESRNLVRDWHSALRSAGLPTMPFHQLRHGYATLMLEAGVDLAVVSKSLGHSTISTTADVYMHVTPGTRRQVAERMGAILRG